MHHYSPEDLLRYIYQEMSSTEAAGLESELARSWALREKLSVLRSAHERLNNAIEAPRTQVILNILKYAASPAPAVSA
jgi:hypothetical protein